MVLTNEGTNVMFSTVPEPSFSKLTTAFIDAQSIFVSNRIVFSNSVLSATPWSMFPIAGTPLWLSNKDGASYEFDKGGFSRTSVDTNYGGNVFYIGTQITNVAQSIANSVTNNTIARTNGTEFIRTNNLTSVDGNIVVRQDGSGGITLSNAMASASGILSVGSNGVVYAATNINFVGNTKITNESGLISVDVTPGASTGGGFETATNIWSGTTFWLGTNFWISSATNIYLTDVGNTSTTVERWGELTIKATANISITNIGSIYSSDQVTSRLIPSNSVAVLAVKVVPGIGTNMAVVQFK